MFSGIDVTSGKAKACKRALTLLRIEKRTGRFHPGGKAKACKRALTQLYCHCAPQQPIVEKQKLVKEH